MILGYLCHKIIFFAIKYAQVICKQHNIIASLSSFVFYLGMIIYFEYNICH